MNLGENIRTRREALKLSQEYVAEYLGVSRQAVSKWETGKSEPTAANLVGLSELLEIGLSELVEDKKAAPDPPPKKEPNHILQANLIKLAIILQASFLYAAAMAIFDYRRRQGDAGAVAFHLILLAVCSALMASNYRFEPDRNRWRKNICIELAYCALQTAIGLLDICFGLGLVGSGIAIVVMLIYLLYINPKFMDRKLTK